MIENELTRVVSRIQAITIEEAAKLLEETAEECVNSNSDPEEVLQDTFGLEPDYLMDFMEYMGL